MMCISSFTPRDSGSGGNKFHTVHSVGLTGSYHITFHSFSMSNTYAMILSHSLHSEGLTRATGSCRVFKDRFLFPT